MTGPNDPRPPPRDEPIAVSSESAVVAEFVSDASADAGYQSEADLERAVIALLQEQADEYLPVRAKNSWSTTCGFSSRR